MRHNLHNHLVPNAHHGIRILTIDMNKLEAKCPWITLPVIGWLVDPNANHDEMIPESPISLIRLNKAPWCLYEPATGQCFSEPLDAGWVGPLTVSEAKEELLRAARHWRR